MKLLILVALIAVAQSNPIEPRIERVDDRTPERERRYEGFQPFIVRGEPAEIANYPHMLALLRTSTGGFICGGSIIAASDRQASSWALTAAHCIAPSTTASGFQWRAGSTRRNSGGTVYASAQIFNHPQYNSRTLANDVTLVRTTVPMSGTNIHAIPIAPRCAATGTYGCCGACSGMITVTGWGRDEFNNLPLDLRRLDAPIYRRQDCTSRWGNIGADVMCKGVIDNRDTCNGDSGGPLIRQGQRLQIAIVSFGAPQCGEPGSANPRPSGNVRIEAPIIRDFISQHTGF